MYNNLIKLIRFYENRKIIILGGGGFIGSNLALALNKLYADIVVVDDFIYGTGGDPCNLKDANVNLVRSRIENISNWQDAIEPNSIVFHCAAKNTHKWCNLHPREDCEINYYPQFSIIQAIHAVGPSVKLIYCSTRTVYKDIEKSLITELSEILPQDVYSTHCFNSERLFQLLLSPQQVRILRLTNTYGPRQRLSGDEMGLVGEILYAALNNSFYQVFQNGMARRDINYVEDVVDALLSIAMLEKVGDPIVHLGGDWVQTKSIIEYVSEITGWTNYEYLDLPTKTISPLSTRRAAELLDWQPNVDLKTGLITTINYLQLAKAKHEISK
ncbi:MAG: NAD(P)-dependent oxidoreductase [Armatimonadetes bacterium]|nr:NAD(P)-dependent oxidoreductase [Armatimonadota bacterium]